MGALADPQQVEHVGVVALAGVEAGPRSPRWMCWRWWSQLAADPLPLIESLADPTSVMAGSPVEGEAAADPQMAGLHTEAGTGQAPLLEGTEGMQRFEKNGLRIHVSLLTRLKRSMFPKEEKLKKGGLG